MVFAVVVFQILMIGIFALKNNATVSTLSIPPLFLTIIFYIFVSMYWKRIATFMELTTFSLLDDDATVDEETLKVCCVIFCKRVNTPACSCSLFYVLI